MLTNVIKSIIIDQCISYMFNTLIGNIVSNSLVLVPGKTYRQITCIANAGDVTYVMFYNVTVLDEPTSGIYSALTNHYRLVGDSYNSDTISDDEFSITINSNTISEVIV
jgi:hypothetical protein